MDERPPSPSHHRRAPDERWSEVMEYGYALWFVATLGVIEERGDARGNVAVVPADLLQAPVLQLELRPAAGVVPARHLVLDARQGARGVGGELVDARGGVVREHAQHAPARRQPWRPAGRS